MGSPSLKNEKKRGRGYSPHRTSSATKQEDRVLGPYLPTKKALTSAATLHKDHQNATKCLLVPAPQMGAGGYIQFQNPGAPPTSKSSGNSQNNKGRKVFDQRVPLGTAAADRTRQKERRWRWNSKGAGTNKISFGRNQWDH